MKRSFHRMTNHDLEHIKLCCEQDLTKVETARQIGCCETTVAVYARKMKLKFREKSKPIRWDAIEQLQNTLQQLTKGI